MAVSKPREFAPLLKTNLLDNIIAKLVVTGQYERIDQALKYRLHDPYVKEVPRLQFHSDDPKKKECKDSNAHFEMRPPNNPKI